MKKYYTKESYIMYANQQNINRSTAIRAIDCIVDTIKKFDGKIYNVKFTKELNSKMILHHLDNTYLSIENYGVYLYVRDNDSYKAAPEKEHSSWEYVNYTYYLPDFFDSSKKIYADRLVPLLIAKMDSIREIIKKSEEEMSKINDIEKQYNTLKNLIGEFNAEITSDLKELFVL